MPFGYFLRRHQVSLSKGKEMHKFVTLIFGTLFLILFLPAHSLAHLATTDTGTFYGGMLSPMFAPDHLLLLMALAVVTIQLGNRANRLVLLLFSITLVTGMFFSKSVGASNSFYPLNLMMILTLGLFTALPGRIHFMLLALLTAMTGLFLGYDVVVKTLPAGSGLPSLSGFALTEILLLALTTAWVPQHLLTETKITKGMASTLILGGGFLLFILFLTSDTSLSLQNLTLPNEESLIIMVETEEMSLAFICTTLLLSLLWGAGHALTPGHGKAIVAAYLIGARSTPWHALYLGLTVTITHTLGIFCLGFIALFASQYILPETLFPWLTLISGIIVVALGCTMLIKRLRMLLGKEPHHHHEHDEHGHSHDHHHEHNHTHSHLPRGEDTPVSWKTLLGLGISGGLLPCPSALVLLLAAISMQRIAFGMVLVFIFSIGLAAVLTTVGLLFIKGSRLIQKIPQASAATRILPIMSALLIFILGVFISWDALITLYT